MKTFSKLVAIVLLAGCARAPQSAPYKWEEPAYEVSLPSTEPTTRQDLLRCIDIIRDSNSSDEDAIDAIVALRHESAESLPVRYWSDIANSRRCSSNRRNWAIAQIFDRYVQRGDTLLHVGRLLSSPTWLKAKDIVYCSDQEQQVYSGARPFEDKMDGDSNDRLFCIETGMPVAGSFQLMIFLKLRGKPLTDDVSQSLQGDKALSNDIIVDGIRVNPYFLPNEILTDYYSERLSVPTSKPSIRGGS